MPDICDDAQQAEAFVIQAALASMPRDQPNEAQLVIAGVVCCLGCGDPIPIPRLAARPKATRCVVCQAEEEAKVGAWRY